MQMALRTAVLAWALTITLPACGVDLPPPAPYVSHPVDLSVIELLNEPATYDGRLIRLTGICRIEFEGNALYADRDAFAKRRASRAIWLNLGWPVDEQLRRLDGQEASFIGIFSENEKGHESAFAAALREPRPAF
jgi:hypothetical protein